MYSEPPPVGTNNVFSFSRDLSMITGVFLYHSLKRSGPDSVLYTPTVILPGAWRNTKLAHKLINPTCLTTTRQALHKRRSVAAVKGQCFSNGRGAEA